MCCIHSELSNNLITTVSMQDILNNSNCEIIRLTQYLRSSSNINILLQMLVLARIVCLAQQPLLCGTNRVIFALIRNSNTNILVYQE